VLRLGGWGVHVPYHVTWAHELDHGLDAQDAPRMREAADAAAIPAALAQQAALA
jgi:putative hydrolase of the HAD superfamily